MELITNPKVSEVLDRYPKKIQSKLGQLRKLILDTASEIDGLNVLEETLKWGEPSYLTKHGSTIRIDWKEKNPAQYAMYFKCTSRLVPTFREIYKDQFQFEGNRAIVFNFQDHIPKKELKHCIALALTYHKVKNLPFLGA